MKISVLDAATLGDDISFEKITKFGELKIFNNTNDDEFEDRAKDSNILIINKVKLTREKLASCKSLKLICVAATGYDNIDVDYCEENNIAVCNVAGYSTYSVSQIAIAMLLSLVCHISEYDEFSKSGEYTKSGIQNRLKPVYYEMFGKTLGIIGMGNIGSQVAKVGEALGCRVIYTRKTEDENAVSLDTLLKESDYISIHTPLTEKTRGMIGEEEINKMAKKPILINTSRGAVCDEAAIAEAVLSGKLSGFGTDVYSVEPFPEGHPYSKLKLCKNVLLTPHMGWGAYESRVRCIDRIAKNIESFINGDKKGRIV